MNSYTKTRLEVIYRGFGRFERHWFRKDAKKTNDGLININCSVTIIRQGLTGNATHVAIITAMYRLYRISDEQLKKILRIPIKADDAEKKELRNTRDEIITAWRELRNLYSWEKFRVKIPNAVDIEKTLEGSTWECA